MFPSQLDHRDQQLEVGEEVQARQPTGELCQAQADDDDDEDGDETEVDEGWERQSLVC